MEKSETSDDCDDKILRVLITEKELVNFLFVTDKYNFHF